MDIDSVALEGSRRIQTPQKLLHAGLDDRSLGLGVGAELLQPAADLDLELDDSGVECAEALVPLALERGGRIREPALEPLRAGVADMCERSASTASASGRRPRRPSSSRTDSGRHRARARTWRAAAWR
jgi:hypothetical protein